MKAPMKPTQGPWTIQGYRLYGPPDNRSKYPGGLTLIGGLVDDLNDWRGSPSETRDERDEFAKETTANANLIVSAVNACQQINPVNPQAVANALPELVEAMRELLFATALIDDEYYAAIENAETTARAALAKAEIR